MFDDEMECILLRHPSGVSQMEYSCSLLLVWSNGTFYHFQNFRHRYPSGDPPVVVGIHVHCCAVVDDDPNQNIGDDEPLVELAAGFVLLVLNQAIAAGLQGMNIAWGLDQQQALPKVGQLDFDHAQEAI